jgi:hypothetical protein
MSASAALDRLKSADPAFEGIDTLNRLLGLQKAWKQID